MEEGEEKIWTGRRGRRRSDGRAAVVGDLVHGRLGLGLWWLSLDEGLMSAVGCSHAGSGTLWTVLHSVQLWRYHGRTLPVPPRPVQRHSGSLGALALSGSGNAPVPAPDQAGPLPAPARKSSRSRPQSSLLELPRLLLVLSSSPPICAGIGPQSCGESRSVHAAPMLLPPPPTC